MAMKVEVKGRKLLIELDLCTPRPSASGKTTLRATTSGSTQTECIVDGQPLVVSVNAYTKGVK